MTNMDVKVNGDTLTITVDLSKASQARPSSTGKTLLVGSTNGAVPVDERKSSAGHFTASWRIDRPSSCLPGQHHAWHTTERSGMQPPTGKGHPIWDMRWLWRTARHRCAAGRTIPLAESPPPMASSPMGSRAFLLLAGSAGDHRAPRRAPPAAERQR